MAISNRAAARPDSEGDWHDAWISSSACAQGWPLALIDLGSLANDPNTMGGPEESRIRFSVALCALEMMGYNALALSATDLKLGVSEVLVRFVNHQGDKLKVVAANVTPDPGLELGQRFVPAVRVEAGPIKVGVTAVVDTASYEKLNDPEKAALLTFRAPDEVLGDVLAGLERDTDIQVLMVQGTPESARRLAQSYPGFEVVVATSPFVDPPKDAEILNDGKTQLISIGRKGQYVGVLGLFPDPKQRLRYQRIELGTEFNGKTEAMRKLVDEDFQAELRQANLLENYPRHAFVFGDSPSDARFVGAETCKVCHPNAYAEWASTGHAKAYESLTKDPKRNREFDPHCVGCHTLGFEYTGGFVSAEKTPQFKNVQCEDCHGPGSRHVTEPTNREARGAMSRSAADFDKNQRCVKCHSEDDSPHFDFATYWPKVIHNKLDKMDDPKILEGLKLDQVGR